MTGIDGDVVATRTDDGSTVTTALHLVNLHGDVIGTASASPAVAGPVGLFETDEFGNPRQPAGGRYGWLGGKARRTMADSGIIQMGVRSYIPALGRFTSVDPILGGSATAYDYANADPVNNLDLTGLASSPSTSPTLQEIALCTSLKYGPKCVRGRELMFRAERAAIRIYGTREDETPANAYVHCYGSALITYALGASFAKKLGNAHEFGQKGLPPIMDLKNNFIGRRIAMNRMNKARGTRARRASRACQREAGVGGALMVLKP